MGVVSWQPRRTLTGSGPPAVAMPYLGVVTRSREITFGVAGQWLCFEPSEGRASGTPTVTVYRSVDPDEYGTPEPATTGACAVDSVNTTIAVEDAYAGARSIVLASGTGVGKRTFLMTSIDTGVSETVDVIGIVGTLATLRRPLINEYPIGSTLQGIRISIAVDAAWAADKSNIIDANENGSPAYRLRWSYVVDGATLIGETFVDLVRYSTQSLVTPNDVDRRFPGFIDTLPTDYREDAGAALIGQAIDAVRMDALGDGQVLRRIRDADVLRELVINRANLIRLENQLMATGANPQGVDLARELYRARFNQLMKEAKYQTDQTGDGSATASRRLPPWRL